MLLYLKTTGLGSNIQISWIQSNFVVATSWKRLEKIGRQNSAKNGDFQHEYVPPQLNVPHRFLILDIQIKLLKSTLTIVKYFAKIFSMMNDSLVVFLFRLDISRTEFGN